MRLVISDTGPINYLVLIGHIDILPVLFEKVIMPVAVLDELTDQDAPPSVQAWIASPPVWIEVEENPASSDDALLAQLDDGERAAITLAAALHAELLLMDDREGVIAARRRGLAVTGTIGILNMAAQRGLLDLAAAFTRLRSTTFRCPEYLNNVVEQDHRFVKQRVWLAKGYGSFPSAWRTLQGIEAVNMIRKGRVRWVGKRDVVGQARFIGNLFGLTA